MSIIQKIQELRKKYPEYAYMKYKTESGKYSGGDWLKASLGQDEEGKDWFITTDCIHCSEDSGNAKTDAELIVALLNLFCNEKEVRRGGVEK